MDYYKRLGANIRSLREAYGEKQKDLGNVIYYDKNTVSYYEAGQRKVSIETLIAIADYYMVPVETLLYSNLTSLGKITIDYSAFWRNIDNILPIVSSDNALKSEYFKKAIDSHKCFYKQLHSISSDDIDIDDYLNTIWDICVIYSKAIVEDEIEEESTANLLALWYLWAVIKKSLALILENPTILRHIDSSYEIDASFEDEIKTILSEMEDDDMDSIWKEVIPEILKELKKIQDWSPLSDYYLGLQYVWNTVENNLNLSLNRQIGIEMMRAFESVGNNYAAELLKFYSDFIRGSSSQSVD